MNKKLKRFDPKSRWVKYQDGLWIQSRKRIYWYWFRFLQIAEQEPHYKVDWSKYRGWGGANFIVGSRFDDFWKPRWKKLFGIKNEGDEPKFPLSTKQPKADALRYALLVYENKHRGSNWEIATWIAKREIQKRGWGLTSSSLFYAREDVYKPTKPNSERYDKDGRFIKDISVIDDEEKMYVQSKIGRYKKAAGKYLDNVCNGIFP